MSGDTVVGDADPVVVHWESTRPETEPGTSSGQIMEFFPDFAPSTRLGQAGAESVSDEGPLHTASEIVPRGVHVSNVSEFVGGICVAS